MNYNTPTSSTPLDQVAYGRLSFTHWEATPQRLIALQMHIAAQQRRSMGISECEATPVAATSGRSFPSDSGSENDSDDELDFIRSSKGARQDTGPPNFNPPVERSDVDTTVWSGETLEALTVTPATMFSDVEGRHFDTKMSSTAPEVIPKEKEGERDQTDIRRRIEATERSLAEWKTQTQELAKEVPRLKASLMSAKTGAGWHSRNQRPHVAGGASLRSVLVQAEQRAVEEWVNSKKAWLEEEERGLKGELFWMAELERRLVGMRADLASEEEVVVRDLVE